MIRPMARGIFVVPDENELRKLLDEGIKYPISTPIPIAKKIHRVKNRSRNLSFVFIEIS